MPFLDTLKSFLDEEYVLAQLWKSCFTLRYLKQWFSKSRSNLRPIKHLGVPGDLPQGEMFNLMRPKLKNTPACQSWPTFWFKTVENSSTKKEIKIANKVLEKKLYL